ncbi:MAG: helix-turn-helix domain-containing protein [Pseudonocardiaceae bacterium]
MSSKAQIVLQYGEGRRKSEIAAMLKTTRPTVDKWIKRYEEQGIKGLVNRTPPGGPHQISDRTRARVLALTQATPPSALWITHLVVLGEVEIYQEDGRCLCVEDMDGWIVAQQWLKPWSVTEK